MLAAGWILMEGLARVRQPPQRRPVAEARAAVRGVVVRPETLQIELQGFATARAWRRAQLAAQVSGRVVEVSPAVLDGRRVSDGEWLVRLDPSDYQAALDQIEADLAALEQRRAQLEQQERNDRLKLEVARRTLALARADYERVRKLVEQDRVESPSRLDQAEAAWRARELEALQLETALSLYPIQRRQIDADREAALVRRRKALLDLARTEIRAPFAGRVDAKNVELGEYVAPGRVLLTLVDDSRLELAVPLEGAEVAAWMEVARADDSGHWFAPLEPVEADVAWVEAPERCTRRGRLDRIERYDAQSRTAWVVVVVEDRAEGPEDAFPLVEGMFCRVSIPGRVVAGVVRLPRAAVGEDGTVGVVEDGRFRTRRVRVLRYEQDAVLVEGDLEAGEIVLTARPGRMLEGMLVDVTLERGVGDAGVATSGPLTVDTTPAGSPRIESGDRE